MYVYLCIYMYLSSGIYRLVCIHEYNFWMTKYTYINIHKYTWYLSLYACLYIIMEVLLL